MTLGMRRFARTSDEQRFQVRQTAEFPAAKFR
jgi:hypothetical protein